MPYPRSVRGRFWVALGSPRAVRFIFALMLVYALVIGGLMLGYANVQQCLADYSDDAALNTQIRVQTGNDDRALNRRIEAADAADRARLIRNQQASVDFIVSLKNNNGQITTQSMDAFINQTRDSIELFANNERERQSIIKERARIDAVRLTAVTPRPPSETC